MSPQSTIRKARELAQLGAHRVVLKTTNDSPRRYQATCRDCAYKGTESPGAQAEREAYDHATETLPVGAGGTGSTVATTGTGEQVTEIAVELTDELLKLVPPKSVYESYVPRPMDGTTDYAIVKKAVLSGKNILLMSDAGAGKNHLAAAVAADLGCPLISISLSGGAQTEDIIGAPVFAGAAQGTVWVDGYFTDFFRHAIAGQRVIVVLDEVNACPNDILFRLHQSLDERRTLVLAEKGREVLQDLMKNCAVIATMNPDYRGTKPLNQAFKRRFQVKLTLDYDKTVEKRLLRQKGTSSAATEKILNLAGALRKSYHDTELSQPLGTADLLNFADNQLLFGEHIARHSLLQNYDLDERAAVTEAIRLHLDGQQTKPGDNNEEEARL